MKIARTTLESISPYSQSRKHNTPALEKEGKDEYERRTWREKCHAGPKGTILIPPMAFSNCIKEAAGFLSIGVPGKGKALYTKHFDAGVLVIDPLDTGIKQADVPGEWLSMNADGKRNSGTRVDRCFPRIDQWKGVVEYMILDDTITEPVFRRVLDAAGQLIGIGRFRPRNRGFYGRYKVSSFAWEDHRV